MAASIWPLTASGRWLRALFLYLALVCLQSSEFAEARVDDYIHGNDRRICGRANFRPWQTRQSAFGCVKPRYRELLMLWSPRGGRRNEDWANFQLPTGPFSDGIPAQKGEVPYFVHLNIVSETASEFEPLLCGGVLIHIDLVLTSASCVAGATRIGARLGNNERYTLLNEFRPVQRYCTLSNYTLKNPALNDLAVLRLTNPIQPLQYVPFKIEPTCVLPYGESQPRQPKESAVCMMTGVGRVLSSTGDPRDDLWTVMTKPVRRACDDKSIQGHSSCYLTSKSDKGCPYDPGSPVICFDNCGDTGLKAHVVGVVSKYFPDRCGPGKQAPFLATDLTWQYENLKKLIYAVRVEGIDDLVTPIKGVHCEEPF